MKAEDYLIFYWLMGRAVRTFIVVPPLKIDNFEDYQNSTTKNTSKKLNAGTQESLDLNLFKKAFFVIKGINSVLFLNYVEGDEDCWNQGEESWKLASKNLLSNWSDDWP